MPLNFPANPVDGQVYDNFFYSSGKGTWKSLSSGASPSLLSNVSISGTSTATVPLTVRGTSGQTANLQEWKDSSGANTTIINSSGLISTPSPLTIQKSGVAQVFVGGSDLNGAVSIGRVDGTASTPYIDFNAGAAAVDYDSRIIAQSGTGVVGGGTLQIQAGQLNLPNKTYAPGSVVQVVDNFVSSATESYTTISDGAEYQAVSVSITPKFTNSKLIILASAQVRIVSAFGINSRIKRDGSYVIGNNPSYSLAFFYKGDQVNHHLDLKAHGSVTSGTTNSTTFAYFVVPFGGTGELVNGRYGGHYLQVMEVAQ